jgi:hypothetical protein
MQNINKEVEDLNTAILRGPNRHIRALHSPPPDSIFISSVHGRQPCSPLYHQHIKCIWKVFQNKPCLGYRTNPNKFKRIEVIQSILPDHDGVKSDINNKKKSGKLKNI